ncbi:hypothetical protein J41TS4_49190 [Paenibacillus apis]|uniref:Uncharacterized protein n=1 Tax=Paenibacillus apis TaxID=1792174 RepID=A0A920CLK3_9BACL|nr:hypothetical protein J41TS4_49190 [Paenibacillus apis]
MVDELILFARLVSSDQAAILVRKGIKIDGVGAHAAILVQKGTKICRQGVRVTILVQKGTKICRRGT